MAVAAVSNSNLRAEDMEGSPTITDIGAGAGGGQEAVTFFQNANSISRKVTNSAARGTGTTTASTVDMTTGDNTTWLSKTFLSDFLDVNSLGWFLRCGNSTTVYDEYVLRDDGTLGDRDVQDIPRGGWIVEAVNPNVTAWIDTQTGTAPTLTTMDVFQVGCGLATGAAKSENIFIDAIDMGDGLYLVGGDGGSVDGTWADFVAHDQGTIVAGRIGHVLTNASGIEVRGKLIRGRTSAGTVTATVATDSLQSLTWPGGRVAAGWNELEDDLGNASTVLTENNTTFAGAGRDNLKRYFDSSADDVDGTNEVITIAAHGYLVGEAVLYSIEGGTVITGLTDATEYFVRPSTAGGGTATDQFELHVTRSGAYAAGTPVGITAAGTGEEHSVTRQPDTRPVYNATGTAGTAAYTGCNFVRFSSMNLTSGVTLESCNIVGTSLLDVNGGTVSGCAFTDPLITRGEHYVTCDDLDDITSCSFTAGADGGHAIERTGTASTDGFSAITLNGYWVHGGDAGDGAEFPTGATGVDVAGDDVTTTNTHGFTTGDGAYYSNSGGASTIGLDDGSLYYVNVISTTNISFHVTQADALADANRVALNTVASEIHTLYSANAGVVNNTGGAMTISVTSGGDTPYVRNVGASTTTVTAAVTITVTPVFVGSEVRAYLTGTNVEVDGVENSSGTSQALNLGSGISVDLIVLSAPTPSRPNDTAAIPVRIENVSFTVDQNLDPFQREEPNFSNP